MRANLIKSLKNIIEPVEIEAGKTARENFPEVNFENAVLIIDGKIAQPETVIHDNNIVTLRLIPADLTETPWWLATFFVPFGFIIQPAEIAYKARKDAEKAQEELEKIKKLTNAPGIDNRPFLRGASNTISTGKSQPYFCGRNFLTPYLFSTPFYEITGEDGENQHVYNILEGGFKDIVLDKLATDDIIIKTFSGTTPQSGVYTIDSGLFAEGQLEIRQDGAAFSTLTKCNTKHVSKVINREVVKQYRIDEGTDEPLLITLDQNTQAVDICINFPYGLYKYNDNNDRVAARVTITPKYSLDGGSTWTAFTFSPGNTFEKNKTNELRYVARKEFSLADYQTLASNHQDHIIITVTTSGTDDQKTKDDCYVYYYQQEIFDPEKSSTPAGVLNDGGVAGLVPCLNVEARERAYSCVMALKLKATKNNEDKLKKINFIATSTARTWDATEGAWSTEKSPTRNPAAIALEVETSAMHPASRYSDSEIDLDAFGALYEYCEANDLKYDVVITQSQKKDTVLQEIADACSCAFYKDIYGRISVAIDQAQENAIAVYNPQNIISLTNKKSFSRRVDALRIRYVNSENDDFNETVYTVTRLENGQPVAIDENSVIKEVSTKGITTHSHVVKYARRLMAADELRQITTTIKIGAEGVYFTPFAKIGIQDPSLNRDAQDTVIKSVTYYGGLLKKIYLQNAVTIDPNKAYGIIINITTANGAQPLPLKVEGSGTTNELNVITTYSSANIAPESGNVASFGELDINGEFTQIVHEFIITRISKTTGGFSLDLQEYNEAMYDSGTIPAYKPIVNNAPTPPAGEIPLDAITGEQLAAAVDHVNADAVQAAVDTIQKGHRFTNVYRVRPVETSLEEIIARLDDEARNRSASISMSEEEILLQVQDAERELVGLISIQAGAVTALVEGGGATGQMSLTLNLPVMIDATKRAQLIAASTEAKVNAVYGLVEGTAYYGIKGNASNAAVKALWNDAVAAGLIASQIDLTATQISINAENVKIDGETIINNAKKIKAALIEVDNLLATNITVKDKGVIHSNNYSGTIDSKGNITAYGTAGWAIDHAGRADFVNGNFTSTTIKELLVDYGLRFANMAGGDTVSGIASSLFNVMQNYKKYEAGKNTFTAAGYLYFTDVIWQEIGEDTNCYCSFSINSCETVWSGNNLSGVILKGQGILTAKRANITDYTLVMIDIVTSIQIYPNGTGRIFFLGGRASKALPNITHGAIYI